MSVVSVSETYDLSTKVNKMSLIAVHTPSADLIRKTYPGMAVNHRFFRFLKCDIKLACASVLPADPLQVGVESGAIAPQDMFNPILYKAVTNESLSTLEYRLRGLGEGAYPNDSTLDGESISAQDSNAVGGLDNFNAYYGLLSNRDGFAVAHPQQGLSMKGLVPLVHERLYQFGDNGTHTQDRNSQVAAIGSDSTGTDLSFIGNLSNYSVKGKAHPLPRMNTTYLQSSEMQTDFGLDHGTESLFKTAQSKIPDLFKTYVAMIIMPPAKLNVLYYRLVIRWYISFEECRPISEVLGFSDTGLGAIGQSFYKSNYTFGEKSEDLICSSMFDSADTNVQKIMEGK